MILCLSEQLTILIATAEDIMRKSPEALPAQLPDTYRALASEIRRIDASPAEGVRATRAGVIMCNAIEGFFDHGDHHWQMLIGATLPVLRKEAWKARQSEKEAAAETRR